MCCSAFPYSVIDDDVTRDNMPNINVIFLIGNTWIGILIHYRANKRLVLLIIQMYFMSVFAKSMG